jgi:hypothetical protein
VKPNRREGKPTLTRDISRLPINHRQSCSPWRHNGNLASGG